MRFFRRLTKRSKDIDRQLKDMSERVDDLRAMVAILTSNFDEIEEIQPIEPKEI